MKIVIERGMKDIRFWIILFFILRLYGITDPPLEMNHSWRQCTGNMVARNFYETDHSIFFPRLDVAGDKTGITGTEFPVLQYLTFLVSSVFGFHNWFARIINLLVSSIGIYYFFKLLRLKFDERLSFYAAYLLLISNWFIYSRKAMPDTFSVALVITGIYFAFRYVENCKLKNLVAYFFFALAGVLSKIPSLFLLIVFVFPLVTEEVPFRSKLLLFFTSVFLCIPVIGWYFYWIPYLNKEYGFQYYYMGVNIPLGMQQLIADRLLAAENFYFAALKLTGFAVFITGLFMAWRRTEKLLLQLVSVCALAFFVFMLKAGGNFCYHTYYIIPFVPVMCVIAGYTLVTIKKKGLAVVLLCVITAENGINHQADFFIKDAEKYKLTLETIADHVSGRSDLIAINCGKNPQQMYFSHRKGWTITSEQAMDSVFLHDLQLHQCKFLFINKHELEKKEMSFPYAKLLETTDFTVYALSGK